MSERQRAKRDGRDGLSLAFVLIAASLVVWMRLVPLSLQGLAPEEASQLTYRDDDGREHVYLRGHDSYLWLRGARNVQSHGTPCDVVRGGECRDRHTYAPVGGRMRYEHSPHVFAIAAMQRFMRLFQRGYPLSASAFLVPLVVGVIGVLPAFAIARRLAGPVGGLFAAVLIGLNPIFLVRSSTGDNDVWNVVLPLFLFWAAISALDADGPVRRVCCILLAAFVATLHWFVWQGSLFTIGVAAAGVGAYVAVVGLRLALGHKDRPVARYGIGLIALLVLLALVTAAVTGSAPSALRESFESGGSVFSGKWREVGETALWADPFATVGELFRPSLHRIAAMTTGLTYFFAAWLGLLLLVLPRRAWQWWHFASLIAGNYLYWFLLTHPEIGQLPLVGILGLSLFGAILLQVLAGTAEENRSRPVGVLIVVWFLAALLLAFQGNRFVMLLVPPFGITFGVAVGRLHEWLARLAQQQALPPRVTSGFLLVLFAALLVAPILQARAGAVLQRPRVNDAWWDTLTKIREETPVDAVVSTWWPYGYWVAHVADRRVSADGGSLPSRVPQWLGRSLLTSNEAETVGLLRMLDCGSDAPGSDEKERGAYRRLLLEQPDGLAARETIVELASLGRDEALKTLSARGIPASKATGILAATHCVPPPAYLILSNEMVRIRGWVLLGNWSFETAYVIRALRTRPKEVVIGEIVERFGYSPEQAAALCSRAAVADTPDTLRSVVSPPLRYLSPDWVACHDDGDRRVCRLAGPALPRQDVPAAFTYPAKDPQLGKLFWPSGGENRPDRPEEILIAGPKGLDSVTPRAATAAGVGVLVDVRTERVLLGSPALLRSMFTHLLFLDGRYTRHFEKFDEREGYGGERVVTWQMIWPQEPPIGNGSESRQ